MKSKFAAFTLLLATVFLMASCLESDNDYTYTDDCAISSFSVTTAKQNTFVKTSDGLRDSLVVKELTLSNYKFYIDQINGKIYNPDSLPCGVDAKKLLCSVSNSSAGLVVIKKEKSDSLDYFSSTDSLDFSVDREVQVVSNSGLSVKKYTVHVNVHKEQADSFAWHATPICAELKTMQAIKTAAVNGKLILLGTDGNTTIVYTNNGTQWTKCETNLGHNLAADAYKSLVTKDDYVYISDGGNIVRTNDGKTWDIMGTATDVTRLVAASRYSLYGYATDGRLMTSKDNGATWAVAEIDDELSLMPYGETTYASVEIEGYAKTDRVMLFGTRDAATYPNDKYLTIWGKIDEAAENSENQPWAYYGVSADNNHAAPLLSGISAVAYDGGVYMMGQEEGKAPKFYKSLDNGITWREDTATVMLPTNFNENATNAITAKGTYALTVDKNKSLWLVNASNGMTWRGRINRLGWAKEQTAFEK
ncbi:MULTISPECIES: DUF6242 domain-containing protein [Prevotellaceae]|uniref:DUF6242 domain-containing protein n=2 Tax=Prevotellaceae TaxID=171552 RepID=UPI001F2D29A7|nr:DUF6242 domain-containing protein [Leyella stercorea]MCF2578032.1 hypothetical protein [Leyella stercorea]MCI7183130.1 DUF6242 domain-containing protein [Prevotella sp.]